MLRKTNWHHISTVFTLDSLFNWFYLPQAVWVLIWIRFFSFSQIAFAMSLGLLWSTFLELPSGALADMIGRKKTILIGRLLLLVGYIYLFYDHSFKGLIIWQFLNQTDSAFSSGAQSALLYDSLKENNQEIKRYTTIEANSFLLSTLGMASASILGGYLYTIHYFLPYAAMIPITALGFLVAFFYQEPFLETKRLTLVSYVKQNLEGVKHIFAHSLIRSVSIFSILVNFVAFIGVWYLYEPRLSVGNFDPRLLSFLVAGTYLARAFGTRLIPILEKRLATHQMPIFLAIFQTLGSALSFFGGKFGAISSVYVRKLHDGYRHPILLTLQNQQIESRYRATALSALNLITTLSVALFGMIIGRIMDGKGVEFTMNLFAVFGLLLVIPSGILVSRKIKKHDL